MILKRTRSALVDTARFIYLNTPSRALRRAYFRMFCALMRGRKTTISINNLRYELDLGETIDIALYLDRFEPEVVSAIKRYTMPGMTVLDIGANIGAHTILFGDLVGRSGAVYAFEPTDFGYNKLIKNIHLNPNMNISAFKLALASTNQFSKEITFRSSWRTDGKRNDVSSKTDFRRLDNWISEQEISRVDLVKIDVDGNEYSVLTGGETTISNYRPVFLMEAVSRHFESDDQNPFLLLRNHGYMFSEIKMINEYKDVDSIRRLLPEYDPEMTTSINLIARYCK
ncbi:MAG: FkbM family methyltransferase [Gammaproteobacteria bacterium]|nr:FkbM family methyltransferase [Gammaproteobacteria bacterium]